MVKRKQILVNLSGKDLEIFESIVESLKNNKIFVADAEVLRMTMRAYIEEKIAS